MLRSMGLWLLMLNWLAACAATPPPAATAPLPTRTSTPRPTPTAQPPLLIVTLGDSLTFGDKDDDPGGGWPRRIQPLFLAQRPGSRVINLALPGWTSHDLLRGSGGAPNQIDQAVKELQRAGGEKMATVWIGVNDLFYLYEFGNPTAVVEAREADRFALNLEELVGRLSATGAHVFIARLHDPAQGRVQVSGVFQSISTEEWARMSQQAEKYNAAIDRVAARYQARLVNIPALNIFTTPELMYEDGIHPNPQGYDALAQVWYEAISRSAALPPAQ